MSKIKVALDVCMSPKLVGVLRELYADRGFEFLHVSNLVRAPTPDTIWADAYKKFGGRVVLSGDCRIAYKPHEAIAFIDNDFMSFFPDENWAGLKGPQKASVLIHAWPSIEAIIRQEVYGTCWRIPCVAKRGEIRLGSSLVLQKLVIPSQVLDTVRRRNTES